MDTVLETIQLINVWLAEAIAHPVKLASFSSVFEIAFGLSAVVYYVELKHSHEREYRKFVENREAILQFLQTRARLNKMQLFALRYLLTPQFPLGVPGFGGAVVLGHAGHSIICSLWSLGLLVLAGFWPDLEVPSGPMMIIIIGIFSFILSYIAMERFVFPAIELFRRVVEGGATHSAQ